MHLTLIISSLNPGGAERVLSELANYWVAKGHQVTLITLASPNARPFYSLDSKINLIQLNQTQSESSFLMRLKNIFKRVFCLRKTLKKLKPTVILSFVDVMNLTTLLAAMGLKIPVTVSERIDPHFHSIPSLYKKIRPFLYGFAYKVIVQTNSAASYFGTTLQDIIQIIPNFVLPVLHTKTMTASIQSMITVGRLDEQKDHKTLIQAFSRLHLKYPHLRLTIYGEGAERKNLENLIDSLQLQEKVFLPGVTQNIHKALSDADLFVFPSRYEGFPNALCEAMAVGLPVIASDCSGNSDIIQDRMNGRLFPVGNIKALTDLIEELLNDADQRMHLAKQAKTVCESFHPERILKLWDEVIEKALKS